jgi:hypothetical protein
MTPPRGRRKSTPFQLLAVAELQRGAALQRTPLAVRERDEPGLADGDRIASGRQLADLEHARIVGHRRAPLLDLGCGDEHARTLDRTAGIGRDHAARQTAGRRRRRLARRGIARRLLARTRRLRGYRGQCDERQDGEQGGESRKHHDT